MHICGVCKLFEKLLFRYLEFEQSRSAQCRPPRVRPCAAAVPGTATPGRSEERLRQATRRLWFRRPQPFLRYGQLAARYCNHDKLLFVLLICQFSCFITIYWCMVVRKSSRRLRRIGSFRISCPTAPWWHCLRDDEQRALVSRPNRWLGWYGRAAPGTGSELFEFAGAHTILAETWKE